MKALGVLFALALVVVVTASVPSKPHYFRFSNKQAINVGTSPYGSSPRAPFTVQDIPNWNQTNPTDAAFISATYTSSQQTYDAHKYIPRFGYTNDFGAAASGSKSVSTSGDTFSYAVGIGILFGIGIFLALVTTWVWIGFCCCRCCRACGCCHCCAGKPSDAPVTPQETKRRLPFLIAVLICCAAASAAGIVGVVFNEQIHSSVAGNSGIIQSTLNIFLHVNTFISSLSGPATSVVANTASVVNSVTGIIAGINSTIATGFSTVAANLTAEGVYLNNTPPFVIGGYSYPCGYCTSAASDINSAVAGINSAAGDTISSMNKTVHDVQSTLIDIQNQIVSNVQSVLDSLNSAQTQVMKAYFNAQSATSSVGNYDNDRRIGFLVLLLLPSLFLVLGALGFLFRKPLPFRIIYWFTFLTMILVWLVFAVCLPLAAFFSDTCVYVDSVQPNPYAKLSSSVSTIVTACLVNAQLTGPTAFNVSSFLNFSTQITFPPSISTPASSYLNFTQLNAVTTKVNSLNTLTFGFDPSVMTGYLAALDVVTNKTAGYWESMASNVTASNPPATGANASAIANYTQMYSNLSSVNVTLNNFLTQLKNNFSNINNQVSMISTSLTNAQNQLLQTQVLLQPLQNSANALVSLAYCGFLGADYKTVKDIYCNDIVYKLGIIAMCCFIIGVFCVPIMVLSVKLADYEERLIRFNKVTKVEGTPEHAEINMSNMAPQPLPEATPSYYSPQPDGSAQMSAMPAPIYMSSSSMNQPPPPSFAPPPDPAYPPYNAPSRPMLGAAYEQPPYAAGSQQMAYVPPAQSAAPPNELFDAQKAPSGPFMSTPVNAPSRPVDSYAPAPVSAPSRPMDPYNSGPGMPGPASASSRPMDPYAYSANPSSRMQSPMFGGSQSVDPSAPADQLPIVNSKSVRRSQRDPSDGVM